MRGLAVVVMIQCHAFNAFARMDVRDGGPYVLSQFVGGMAAPLFLFMAGMTIAFQMESLERREAGRGAAGWCRCGARVISWGSRCCSASAIGLGSYPSGSRRKSPRWTF